MIKRRKKGGARGALVGRTTAGRLTRAAGLAAAGYGAYRGRDMIAGTAKSAYGGAQSAYAGLGRGVRTARRKGQAAIGRAGRSVRGGIEGFRAGGMPVQGPRRKGGSFY